MILPWLGTYYIILRRDAIIFGRDNLVFFRYTDIRAIIMYFLGAVGPLHPLLQARLSVFIVHFSYFTGFVIACLLSWYPGNYFVMSSYKHVLEKTIEESPVTMTKSDIENEMDAELRALDIKFGRRIGKLERIFYIYSFMFNSLNLLSAWVVFKAFFGWIQKQQRAEGEASPASTEQNAVNSKTKIREISQYHLYLWGNGLSILLSLGLSKLGIIVSESVYVTIRLYKDLLLNGG